MNIVILPIIYLLLINNLCNAAYIFGYMLHNPIASEGMAMMSDEPTVQNDTRIKCKIDSDCDSDMYCDSHYGYCGHLLEEGELCRRDEQCRKKHICIFGNCELPSKPGHKGSRCKGDDDCKPNLCCARQHGEKICKSKLQKGNRCFVPLGGLDYSLNELCPCTEGLVCTKHKRKHRKRMSETDHLRCHPSNTSIE